MMNIEKIKPTGLFTNYIYKAIPLAFDESMSYYETLCGLLSYLKDTVIPALNNNADAIIELQNLMTQLQDYVDNYFENLDVQTEINNKLDEMAESGQLTDIIAQYLQLQGVLAFNTLSDLENAENIVNGSICMILGKNTYNDGKTAYYKIRNILNTDVVDVDNLIAITNNNQLVGEKIPNYYINQLTSNVNTLNSQMSLFNNKKVIMIGDSYANRENSWQDRVKSYANLSDANCNMKRVSGVGFVNTQGGVNFITMLTDNITIPANEVTDIIVCGGYNDSGATEEQLFTALNTFLTTCKNTYPNAHVYIGFISWTTNKNVNYSSSLIDNLIKVKYCYSICGYWYHKAHYLNNVEYSLHNMAFIDNSYFHPTERGQLELALNITRAWITGSTNVCPNKKNIDESFTLDESNGIVSKSGTLYASISNDISRLFSESTFSLTYDELTSINLNNDITIGEITDGYIFGRGYTCRCTTTALINTKNNGYFMVPAMVWIENGILKLRCKTLNRNGNGWVSDALKYIQLFNINIICNSMQQM